MKLSRNGNLSTTFCSENGILGIENVGGDLDAVTGKRVYLRVLPVELGPGRWVHHPAGCHGRQGPGLPDRSGRERSDAHQAVRGRTESTRRRTTGALPAFASAGLRGWRTREPVDRVQSQFLPGGGAGPDSTPFEKVYVVLEGEMTLEWDGKTEVLRAMDSCTVPPGQERRIENKSNHVCKMLVVIPYPEGGRP